MNTIDTIITINPMLLFWANTRTVVSPIKMVFVISSFQCTSFLPFYEFVSRQWNYGFKNTLSPMEMPLITDCLYCPMPFQGGKDKAFWGSLHLHIIKQMKAALRQLSFYSPLENSVVLMLCDTGCCLRAKLQPFLLWPNDSPAEGMVSKDIFILQVTI